eukprot:2450032-Rhodomonas_salina.1
MPDATEGGSELRLSRYGAFVTRSGRRWTAARSVELRYPLRASSPSIMIHQLNDHDPSRMLIRWASSSAEIAGDACR